MADSKPASWRAAASASRTMSSGSSSALRRTAVRASCWAGEAALVPPRSSRRAPSSAAQRSASATAVASIEVGRLRVEHADDAPAHPQRHAQLAVDARDGLEVVLAGGDVVDERQLAGAERAADHARRRRHAVEHLPVAAHGLAAQAPAVLEVDARHQAAAGEVHDDGLGGLAGARRGRQLALQPPRGRAAPHGGPGHGLLGPRLGRAAEQPSLAVVDLGVAQHVELLRPLDALGDDPRAHLVGEGDGGAQHGLAAGVAVDAGDHAAAQLEEVGPDLGHVLERAEARAGVVDGDQRAAGDPRAQALAQQEDVLHGVLLGELDHQPGGQAGRPAPAGRDGRARRGPR